jgi:hypothetical protein
MCLFHKWNKWEQYRAEYTYQHIHTLQIYDASELRQKRVCSVCGKMQDELIKKG